MALLVSHRDEESYFGDELQLDVGQKLHFAEMIFWLLAERRPTAAELAVFGLILNLSIDHGSETPSAKATIAATKAGHPISEAVASGIKEIDHVHGGAQEALMPILYQMVKGNVSAATIIRDYLLRKERVPGFGHRLYTKVDPRAELILTTLQAHSLGEEYIKAGCSLGQTLKQVTGKDLPFNIDGAIAVALCAFDFPSALGAAVFIVARTPGLCAHFISNRPET